MLLKKLKKSRSYLLPLTVVFSLLPLLAKHNFEEQKLSALKELNERVLLCNLSEGCGKELQLVDLSKFKRELPKQVLVRENGKTTTLTGTRSIVCDKCQAKCPVGTKGYYAFRCGTGHKELMGAHDICLSCLKDYVKGNKLPKKGPITICKQHGGKSIGDQHHLHFAIEDRQGHRTYYPASQNQLPAILLLIVGIGGGIGGGIVGMGSAALYRQEEQLSLDKKKVVLR